MDVVIQTNYPNILNNSNQAPKIEIGLTRDGIDGLSAYEIAQKYGYTGTEEEFVSKLNIQYKQEYLKDFDGVSSYYPLVETPILNTVNVYLNGLKLIETLDYAVASNIITLTEPPLPGDVIFIDYNY